MGLAAIVVLSGAAGCSGRGGPIELALQAGPTGSIELGGWVDATGTDAVRVTVDGKDAGTAPVGNDTRTTRRLLSEQHQRSFTVSVRTRPGKHFVCVIPVVTSRGEGTNGAPTCRGIDTGAGSTTTTAAPPTTAPTPAPTTAPTTAPSTTVPPVPAPPTTGPTTVPTTNTTPPPAPPVAPTPPVTDWSAAMLSNVNARRGEAGQPALTACPSLQRAAQAYADLLNSTGHFDHVGPDGSTVSTRAAAAGYVRSGNRFGLAENIARGQQSVDAVMTGWMNSSGHRANILSPSLTHVGFGRSGNTWVQNFGTGGTC